MLSEAQKQAFARDGYLVLPGVKGAAEISAVRARAEQIVEAFDPAGSKTIFSTTDQGRHTDAYFLESGDRVRCFFEEEAFDATGALRQAKSLSINKIGHALHDLDPVFGRFSREPKLAAVAADVGLRAPQIWQSMYIFKQPGIGGEVRWHQDATFFETDPITVTTFWFALEAADRANGCLWVEPAGHRGPLRERFVRKGNAVHMEKLDATPWPTEATAVPVEVAAGALVLLHGRLPHYSAPNRSAMSRHAYTLHVTDGTAKYAAHNWLQRGTALPVRGF